MLRLLFVAWMVVSPVLAHGEPTFSYDRRGARCVAESAAEVVQCIRYCRTGLLRPGAEIIRSEAAQECRDFLVDDWLTNSLLGWLGDVPV